MEPSSSQQPTFQSGVREKIDPAWNHFIENRSADGRKVYKCLHCSIEYKGGGINRMKQHLAGVKGNISACKKVPFDIQIKMQENLKLLSQKKQATREESISLCDSANTIENVISSSLSKSQSSTAHMVAMDKGKRKLDELDNFFAPRTKPGSQPSLKSVLATKEVVQKADMALARWFFDCCIPFNILNSPFAQQAIDAITAIGPGYKLPSYHRMRVNLLKDCKDECTLLVDSYKRHWKEMGCTLMADGWTDTRNRTLINFLVYCPRGISFIKSIDASDVIKDANTICSMFIEVVEWVGAENIIHLVTDNAANYKKAGDLLHEKFGGIYWSPCAAHCMNLILKDIGSMPHVDDLAKRASKITIFVYNHIFVLSWLRKRPGWIEIVRPGATRFATTFITLKSICEHKHDLQAFATSKYFSDSKLAKTVKGKEVVSIILDAKFWNECLIMSKLAGPLIKLLRVVDSDQMPSMGYVYDGMFRVRKSLKMYLEM